MTNGIPLDELSGGADTTRRDQWGRYMVVPPNSPKPVGYTRVTTVAKALDSGGGLAPWKATMTAAGIIMRRGLRSRWEALVALYGDPWYSGDIGKRACKELVEECAAVGGANDRKEMGSSLHTLTALVDLGRAPTHLTEETERDVRAYLEGRQAAGIAVVPGMIETTVVLDTYQVAGTFDRLVTVPGFDLPLISDLKTGANLEYSWQSIAIQLAGYSRANDIYIQGPAKDGSQDQRRPMPKVDQHHGLIFWLPADKGELELWLVDLDSGWEAFQHSMWARGWRNQKPQSKLGDPQPTLDNDLTKALQASLDEINKGTDETVDALAATLEAIRAEDAPASAADIRDWLQGRINVIGHHENARGDLGRAWPKDMPTLRASDTHTPEQLGVIEQLLDSVERRWEIVFPPPKPGSASNPVARVVQMFPGSQVVSNDSDNDNGGAA
jgi:hypothetical protein